jgi:hypothetical protein
MKKNSVIIILILFISFQTFSQERNPSDSIVLLKQKIDSIVEDRYSSFVENQKTSTLDSDGFIRNAEHKLIGYTSGFRLMSDFYSKHRIFYANDGEYYKVKRFQFFYKDIEKKYYYSPRSIDLIFFEEIVHHFIFGIRFKTYHGKFYFDSNKLFYSNKNVKNIKDLDIFLNEILNKYNIIEP